MNPNLCLKFSKPLGTTLVSKVVLLFWLASVCPGSSLEAAASAKTQPDLTPVERFIHFVTDFPPVESLICEWTTKSQREPTFFQFRFQPSDIPYEWEPKAALPDSTYRFRYKPAAFFARSSTSLQQIELPITHRDKATGVWRDFYWFLDPQPGDFSALETYFYSPHDWGNALAGYAGFMSLYNHFATFGISADGGRGSIVRGKKAQLELITDTGRFPIDLKLVDGVPVQASFRRPFANGLELPVIISYKYDTNIAPLGIPSEWHWEGLAAFKLIKLELGNAVPQIVFAPPTYLYSHPQTRHYFRIHKEDYALQNGIMERIDHDPERAIRRLEKRKP
jgi:hypothetical protein